MTDNSTSMDLLIDRAEEFGKTTLELYKLQAIDKSADVVSSLVSRVVVLIVVALSVLIINFGFAFLIGKYLGSNFYGFFIIGGFYAVIALLLHLFRHSWLKLPASNAIIEQMLKQKSGS